MPLFLPEFGIQDGWKNSIQNVHGKLKAPVVDAGSYYLTVYNIKGLVAKILFSLKSTVANMQKLTNT